MHYFLLFLWFPFFHKMKYVKQSSWRRYNWKGSWRDAHTIMTWDYEGEDLKYFLDQEDGKYNMNISWLLKNLLYKDIPVTLYVRTENVLDR
jgi:hypothetical protein